jgi:aminoglycoside phosphotransferase (APT) family kinase protein
MAPSTETFGSTSPQQQAMPFWPPSGTDQGRRCDDINRLTDWARIEKTYVKIQGEWRYLYRAVDMPGLNIVSRNNDFRTGNFMIGQNGVTGTMDWEFEAWRDPHEDIG